MKRITRWIALGAVGAMVPFLVVSLAPNAAAPLGGQGQQPSQPVTVTNTPLPVSQSGTWNVGITGTPNVNVNGKIGTYPATPANSFSFARSVPPSGLISGPDPAGTRYAITSFTAANRANASNLVDIFAAASNTGCETLFNTAVGPAVLVSDTLETAHASFVQPFVLAVSGGQTCLFVEANLASNVTIVGYRIPPS